jgi:hypothetical protein
MISRSLTANIVLVFLMLCVNAEARLSSRNACFDQANKVDNSQEYTFLMNWVGKDVKKTVALQLA